MNTETHDENRLRDAIQSGRLDRWAKRCHCRRGKGRRIASLIRHRGEPYLFLPGDRQRWAETHEWVTRDTALFALTRETRWPLIRSCTDCGTGYLFHWIAEDIAVIHRSEGFLIERFYRDRPEWAAGDPSLVFDLSKNMKLLAVSNSGLVVYSVGRGVLGVVAP